MTTIVNTIEDVTTVTFASVGPQGSQGNQGPQGMPGRPFTLRGNVATAAELPDADNQAGDAFITDDTSHLFVWDGSQWVDGGSVRGPQGAQGLPGQDGSDGIDGAPGRPFNLRGAVAAFVNLPASGNEPGDAYVTDDDGHLHCWNGIAWIDGGKIRGEQGPQGPPAAISAGEGIATSADGAGNTLISLSSAALAADAAALTAVQPSSLATVAASGSYNDLVNRPSIPVITISTAAPSGTPADDQIWIQREA